MQTKYTYHPGLLMTSDKTTDIWNVFRITTLMVEGKTWQVKRYRAGFPTESMAALFCRNLNREHSVESIIGGNA